MSALSKIRLLWVIAVECLRGEWVVLGKEILIMLANLGLEMDLNSNSQRAQVGSPCLSKSIFTDRTKIVSMLLMSLIWISISFILLGCNSPHNQKRPPTYLTLGFVEDLKRPETYLPDKRLLLRFDERGFWVMSTQCPYDSSPLRPREEEEKIILASDLSASTYSVDGDVLSGPAKYSLPFYKLEIAEQIVGGPKDTLYVHLGSEVDSQWRLAP